MSNERKDSGSNPLLPCSGCGVDLYAKDVEETTELTPTTNDFSFQGEPCCQEVPAITCPECNEVTPL